MSGGAFIAVDWGTTNRRAFLVEGGAVVREERDGLGILSVAPGGFPAAAAALRARMGGAPMLMAGMVGSNRGWVDAGYVRCPATVEALAAGVARVGDGVAIAPGVSVVEGTRGDVMRGEEMQLLGAAASGLAPADALLCHPGTHCKWARMEGGAIAGFSTAMTGEMFALLKAHALIGAAMTEPVADGPAFREGVARSAENDLLTALFGVRPVSILGLRPDAEAAAYVSGLLIGSDCRAGLAGGADRVHLLGGTALGALYRASIEEIGAAVTVIDDRAAFLAGITQLWELI